MDARILDSTDCYTFTLRLSTLLRHPAAPYPGGPPGSYLDLEVLELGAFPLLHRLLAGPLPLGVLHALLDHLLRRLGHARADLGLLAAGGRGGVGE